MAGHNLVVIILTTIIISSNVIYVQTENTDFQIVGVFEEPAQPFEIRLFKHAVGNKIQNQTVKFASKIVKGDSFYIHRRVCRLAREGIAGIFVHSSPEFYAHISPVCKKLEIPCFQAQWDENNPINLLPKPDALYRACRDLIEWLNWKYFLVIYDTIDELYLLQETLNTTTLIKRGVRFAKLPPGNNYIHFLQNISRYYDIKNILVACDVERTDTLLHQAQLVGMIDNEFTFILTTLDVHVLNWDKIKYSGVAMYSYQLMTSEIPDLEAVIVESSNLTEISSEKNAISSTTMTTQMAAFYDTIQILKETVQNNGDLRETSLYADCRSGEASQGGRHILDSMKNVASKGLTGEIRLDEGQRKGISLKLVKLSEDGFKSIIGYWMGTLRNVTGREELREHEVGSQSDNLEEGPKRLAGKMLNVTTIINPPFAIYKDKHYAGHNILLLRELSKLLGFKYEIHMEEKYGMKSKDNQTVWDGAIGLLMDNKTDIVISDMNVTPERMEVVDFTIPFMDTGISILHTIPQPKPWNLLSFVSPFSHGVWGLICLTFLGASITMIFVTQVTPFEIVKSEPNDAPEKHYTISNTVWFTLSSLLQQGSDLSPKSFSLRMLTAFWWFFGLVLVASYAANLATLSIIHDLDDDINSFNDLINQTKVKYGCVRGGLTERFFQEKYPHVWKGMEFKNTTEEGVQAVKDRNGTFALFIYSSYIDYELGRECGLRKVGEDINTVSFAIALPKGSRYLRHFNKALLKLQVNGTLEALRSNYLTNDSSVCEASSILRERAPLKLARIGGIFILVLLGCAMALIFALIDAAWKSRSVKFTATKSPHLCCEIWIDTPGHAALRSDHSSQA